MPNLETELSFQKEIAKNVNTRDCSSCVCFKLINKKPSCLFDGLSIYECSLVDEYLHQH